MFEIFEMLANRKAMKCLGSLGSLNTFVEIPDDFATIQEFTGIGIFGIFEIFENLGSRREEQSGEANTYGGFCGKCVCFAVRHVSKDG